MCSKEKFDPFPTYYNKTGLTYTLKWNLLYFKILNRT